MSDSWLLFHRDKGGFIMRRGHCSIVAVAFLMLVGCADSWRPLGGSAHEAADDGSPDVEMDVAGDSEELVVILQPRPAAIAVWERGVDGVLLEGERSARTTTRCDLSYYAVEGSRPDAWVRRVDDMSEVVDVEFRFSSPDSSYTEILLPRHEFEFANGLYGPGFHSFIRPVYVDIGPGNEVLVSPSTTYMICTDDGVQLWVAEPPPR